MVKKIEREELVRMINKGEKFKLVDVLSKEIFENEHIKGAISIPLDEIDKNAGTLLKKGEQIVTYCASFECTASTKAAGKLLAMGYQNVWDYKGGLKDYKAANLPLEGRLHTAEATAASSACCCCAC